MSFRRISATGAVCLLIACSAAAQKRVNTVDRVSVNDSDGGVQVEIDSSASLAPRVQLVHDPDRLVIDFLDAVPGKNLRTIFVNRNDVRQVRTNLFATTPPITRVVLDLDSPQPYQLVPAGNSLVIKMGAFDPNKAKKASAEPAVFGVTTGQATTDVPQPQTQAVMQTVSTPMRANRFSAPVRVKFAQGMLTIQSEKATLAQVLAEIRRQTGSQLNFSGDTSDAGLGDPLAQDQVVGDFGPASPQEVLSALLNGTHYNFVLAGWYSNKDERQILLTPRGGGVAFPTGNYQAQAVESTRNVPAESGPPPTMTQPQPGMDEGPQEMPEQENPQQNFAGPGF